MDILLVDDSRTMRLILQRAIRQAGYRGLDVLEAENGLQALEHAGDVRAGFPKAGESRWEQCALRIYNFGGVC